jgi:hypothetical protein
MLEHIKKIDKNKLNFYNKEILSYIIKDYNNISSIDLRFYLNTFKHTDRKNLVESELKNIDFILDILEDVINNEM